MLLQGLQGEKNWSLNDMTFQQLSTLNNKLDDFQEKPRNRSEPRMKYMPSPDFSPKALEEAEPH